MCLLFLVAAGQSAGAAANAWLDVEGRIQYAFYTEDTRALAEMVDQLGRGAGEGDLMQAYYGGLANYRLALVLVVRDKAEAKKAVERCVAALDAPLRENEGFAAGLALQSACLRTLAILRPWNPLTGSKSSGQMERAVKLAPRDPRVLLLHAFDESQGSTIDELCFTRLKQAATAFERERYGADHTPGWGAAETYAYIGRAYLERGDVLAARDALERALLLAPDFALARRLLSQITTG